VRLRYDWYWRARAPLDGVAENLPGNEQIAVCDVYEANLDQAITLIGSGAKRYSDTEECSIARRLMVVIGSRTTGTNR
jgi:hypothetical protein